MTVPWPTPDQLLAALLPLALLLVAWRLLSSPLGLDQHSAQAQAQAQSSTPANSHSDSQTTGSTSDPGRPLPRLAPLPPAHPLSLPTAINGYASYARIATAELARMRTTLAALPRASRRLALDAGYGKRLDALAEATQVNESVVADIVRLARERAHEGSGEAGGGGWEMMLSTLKGDLGGEAGPGSIERVREALKHLVRDWSTDGASERETFHTPIVEALALLFPDSPPSSGSSSSGASPSESSESPSDSSSDLDFDSNTRPLILLPGAALSRLAHTLSSAPHNMHAHACELSAYPLLALRLLLNEKLTPNAACHEIRPWAHWFSHQRGEDVDEDGRMVGGKGAMRGVRVPDVVPRLSPAFQILEGDFLHVPAPSGPGGYDAVATLFFIDTSVDVPRTIAHIFALLKPGGWWINLGPLLWTGGGRAVELSLAEVLSVCRAVGFEIYGENMHEEAGGGDEQTKKKSALGRRTIRGEYTADREAMMRWVYEAEFWVARKPA